MEKLRRLKNYDLTVVNAVSKGKLGSSFVINAIICALGFFCIPLCRFGAGYWIVQQLESSVFDFYCGGNPYWVLIIILVLNREGDTTLDS